MIEKREDKILNHVITTMEHKSYVIRSCLKMVKYLQENGKEDMALALLYRANIHDNSKLVGPELELLANLEGNQDTFINPNVQLSENQQKIIEKHWENNRHHPEYFDNIEDMTELDIIEMVCDWYARSMQYKTDFLSFVKSRQENRFHFTSKMFESILRYCEVLNIADA